MSDDDKQEKSAAMIFCDVTNTSMARDRVIFRGEFSDAQISRDRLYVPKGKTIENVLLSEHVIHLLKHAVDEELVIVERATEPTRRGPGRPPKLVEA